MSKTEELLSQVRSGDRKALARCISVVENETEGYEEILSSLQFNKNVPLIGLTGPPGAGKSTLINQLIKHLSAEGKKTAVLAVDPTSPYTHGSLLGDRVRMSEHFGNTLVYIRSLATRGSLGGLSAKTIEITEVLKQCDFDLILIETVGVGQSELEIASLADTTILVLVPGAGDEIQLLKSGILEIADIFVVNKSDRGEADSLARKLEEMVHSRSHAGWEPPVVKASAVNDTGVNDLLQQIRKHSSVQQPEKKQRMLFERVLRLISNFRMKNVNEAELSEKLNSVSSETDFNLYQFAKKMAK